MAMTISLSATRQCVAQTLTPSVARDQGINAALENHLPKILHVVVMAKFPLRVETHCTQHPT